VAQTLRLALFFASICKAASLRLTSLVEDNMSQLLTSARQCEILKSLTGSFFKSGASKRIEEEFQLIFWVAGLAGLHPPTN